MLWYFFGLPKRPGAGTASSPAIINLRPEDDHNDANDYDDDVDNDDYDNHDCINNDASKFDINLS